MPFITTDPRAEDELRRILTLKLATVREGEEPTRRRAPRSEFTDGEVTDQYHRDRCGRIHMLNA